MNKAHEIRELARAFEEAKYVEVSDEDRAPPANLNALGKQWVVEGLKLLAEKYAKEPTNDEA